MFFLTSVFEITLVIFFFLLGILAICFAFFSGIRAVFLLFLQNNLLVSFLFGIVLLAVSFGLSVRLILSMKKKRYTIRNASLFLEISPEVIESSCKRRLWHLFPNHEVFSNVRFHDKKCIIELGLPDCEKSEQKNIVCMVEKEIKTLLQETLDYRGNFLLHIYFS